MSTRDAMPASRQTLAFLGFAILIPMRDILLELWIEQREDALSLAILLCGTTAALGFLMIMAESLRGLRGNDGRSPLQDLFRKMRGGRLTLFTIAFGALTGLAYAVGLELIQDPEKLGAGRYNMIDYGVTPIATALIGAVAFKNRFHLKTAFALGLFVVGMVALNYDYGIKGLPYLTLAAVVAIVVAATDGLSAWLRD